jgi:hypothetical protein
MRVHLLPLIALAVALDAQAAAVPSPIQSTVPPCIQACPAGDRSSTVVVRDAIGIPIEGSIVELDFSACSSFPFCPTCTDTSIVDPAGHRVLKPTTASGRAQFALCGGPSCGLVRVIADGVFLGNTILATPDVDGDLSVTSTDQGLVAAAIGGSDLTRDLDCDGFVTSIDLAVVSTHLGHHCGGTTLARPWSWGRTKVIYR